MKKGFYPLIDYQLVRGEGWCWMVSEMQIPWHRIYDRVMLAEVLDVVRIELDDRFWLPVKNQNGAAP